MRVELQGLEVRGAECSERCATAIENAGGYVVVLGSVLESRALTVVSCYLADLGGPTAVSHLRLLAGRPRQVTQRVLEALAGQSHARACLLDHAAELRDTLGELLEHEQVSVDVAEATLEQAVRVWSAERG
ncbi:MAG: hypothetical protein ACXVII_38575 [Solirubrobacteraceae bacterium]